MKTALPILAMAAAMATAQVVPTAPPGGAKPAGAAQTAPARKAASAAPAVPSYQDLKYPPLRAIAIPPLEPVTLPNGMRLYLVEDHDLPTVSGLALVRTGNLFDPGDHVGLASVTGEVMRTGGAGARSGEQVNERLDNLAAMVESGIGETSGVVSFAAPKENADEVLGIFKDVLAAPQFNQDKIDQAKQQMRMSIARRNDDPGRILQREFTNTIYGKDTPYGWGMEYSHVERITRGDVQGFYRRYFFPKNAMLAVWGDFELAEMKARIEKLFVGWNSEQAPVPEFPKVSGTPAPGVFLARKNDAQQTLAAVGQLGGDARDKDYAALEVMAGILEGGDQARLFQKVGVAVGGGAANTSARWMAGFDHPGLFQISASLQPFSTVAALRAVLQEVTRIRTQEVTDEELRRAKERAVNGIAFAFDTRNKTMRTLMAYEYFGYPRDFFPQHCKALEGVTRADVLRVARGRLDPATMTIVVVGNPTTFEESLGALGVVVIPVDLTIPPARAGATAGDAASRQRGKDLLARAQQAAGGADKLAAVKDYTVETSYQFDPGAGGLVVNQTDRWIAPSHFRQDGALPAGKLSVYIDGASGWISLGQGSGALTGAQLRQVQGDLFRAYFTLLLSDRTPGRTVNSLDENTVEISDDTGQIVRLVLDSATGLPVNALYETPTAAGQASVTETYSDYRDVGGVKLPFKTNITMAGRKYAEATVKRYQINSGLQVQDLARRP